MPEVTIAPLEQIKILIEEFKTANSIRQKEIQGQVIDLLAEEMNPEAKEIVDRYDNDTFPTTQYNYGKYMQALGMFKGIYQVAMIKALRKNGAGLGLDSAVKIIKG
jgi:hypothetical protein